LFSVIPIPFITQPTSGFKKGKGLPAHRTRITINHAVGREEKRIRRRARRKGRRHSSHPVFRKTKLPRGVSLELEDRRTGWHARLLW
jgi:hypothetical protein